jgi:gluconate 2-dehydrogenase gamma chain
MKALTRRAALKLAAAPAAAAIVWTPLDAERAAAQAQQSRRDDARRGTAFTPRFFSAHEYATVAVLVDLIIPKDERSGSATEAGVPEFMDFMMIDLPARQTAMRGGLASIDRIGEQRFGRRLVDCSDGERRAILDDIAYPSKAPAALSQAVAFFNSFRDLTASGFWTTKMGIADLGYQGNTFVAEWNGCPQPALDKLGVKYRAD